MIDRRWLDSKKCMHVGMRSKTAGIAMIILGEIITKMTHIRYTGKITTECTVHVDMQLAFENRDQDPADSRGRARSWAC